MNNITNYAIALTDSVSKLLLEKVDRKKRPRIHINEKVFEQYRKNEPIGISHAFNDLLREQYSSIIHVEWQTSTSLKAIELKEPQKLANQMGYRFLPDRLEKAECCLDKNLKNSPLFKDFKKDIFGLWANNQSFIGCHVDDYESLIPYFIAADKVLANYEQGVETDYRHFSIQVFGQSKKFNSSKSGVAKLLKLNNPELQALQPEDILSFYGLTPLAHPIYISGSIQLQINNHVINASFPPSIGVFCDELTSLSVNEPLTTVTTIENLATFNHYVRTEKQQKELVIYTAGFPSPSFLHLYRMLDTQLKDVIFRHWSDIDEGGFRILHILDKSIKSPVLAFRMKPSDYKSFLSDSNFSTTESNRLDNLNLSEINKKILKECLKANKKIEQEAYYNL